MKIYSARGVDKFDKFVGRDVWVKIHVSAGEGYDYFYRFLNKDADGDYICNRIPDYWAENVNFWGESIKTEALKPHFLCLRGRVNRYEIVDPVEVYTTEELFGNILQED